MGKKQRVTITIDDTLLSKIDKIVFERRKKEEQSLKQTSRSEVIEELVRKGMEKS